MLYPDFLLALFQGIKQLGLTCLIDSNGTIDFSNYPELVKISDGVMLDIKAGNADFHQELTGVSEDVPFKNLRYLQKIGKLFEVRTVVLPKKEEENKETVKIVESELQEGVPYKLLGYRPFGVREQYKKEFSKDAVSKKDIESLMPLTKGKGIVI